MAEGAASPCPHEKSLLLRRGRETTSEIRWFEEMLADVERLTEFLRTKYPEAARRAVRTIMDSASLLLFSEQWDGAPGTGYLILRYIVEDEDSIVSSQV